MRADVLRSVACACALALSVVGCGGSEPLIPPTELQAIEPTVRFEERWRAKVGSSVRRHFTPAVTASLVVVADRHGRVIAVDRESGDERWAVDLDLPLSSGVAADRTQAYLGGAEGEVVALRLDDGTEAWRARSSSAILAPVGPGFGLVLARSIDGRVTAFDRDAGTERWSVRFPPPALNLHGYGSPVPLDGGVLAGLDDGRLVALDLDTGQTIWETVLSLPSGRSEVERLVDVDAAVEVDPQSIYAVNYQGRLARIEPARGAIEWSVPMSSTAGLVRVDDAVVVVDEEDTIAAFSREDGSRLWRTEALRGRRLSPPVVDRAGRLLVGDLEGYLHALSSDDGSLVGRSRVARSPVQARPVATPDGDVFVQSVDGRVTALVAGD